MREYGIPNAWERLLNDEDLARIVGDLTGDGHLQLSGRRGLASFYSKDIKAIKNQNRRFKRLFNVEGHIYTDRRENIRYKIFFSSKKLAAFLASIKVPVGNKTNEKFSVPNWIMKSDRDIKSSYLRGIFTAEACVSVTKKRWRIHIEQYKSVKMKKSGVSYMSQLRLLLKEFGIVASPVRFGKGNIRKDGSKSIRMQFDIEKRYFDKFYKFIGFDNKIKNHKLKMALRGKARVRLK